MNVRPTYGGGRWGTRRSAGRPYVANRKKKKKAKVKKRKRARRKGKAISDG